MGPSNNLTYMLQHLAAVMSKQSEQLLQEQLGIGMSQYRILMVLDWNPRIGQKAIADSLGQTEASISRQIKLLKEKELLVTQIDPHNRRKHITAPTPRGMQATESATEILRRHFSQDVVSLGEDQLMQLSTGLQRLHKIICRPGKAGACDHQLGF